MRIFLVLGLVIYPLLVYLFIDRLQPILLIGIFALLAIGRLLSLPNLNKRFVSIGLIIIILFCICAIAGQQFGVLKLYPVLISLAGAIYGIYTLIVPPSAIEQIVRIMNMQVKTERAENYLRGVTILWVGFFILNACIAAGTAVSASTGIWALYNGLISYIIIAVIFSAEYIFRAWYRKKYGSV